ncbi:MAG: hypothetical protein IJT08_00160 [Alphaproteobacteria bacterium]|nr:hypothetical protein [Alphaproteobacteria bacterium]
MIDSARFSLFLQSSLASLICIATSFMNYCVVQAIGAYFLPLTAVSLFLLCLRCVRISVIAVAFIGIIDDVFSDSFLGTFPFLYALMLCLLQTRTSQLSDKTLTLLFVMIFLGINALTYRSFCS